MRVGNLQGYWGRISPDGNRIGYVKGIDGSLHVAGIDGTNDRTVRLNEKLNAQAVYSWIDDKTVIANLNDKETDEGGPWKVDVDGGKHSPIVPAEKVDAYTCCAVWIAAFDTFFYERFHKKDFDFDIWGTTGKDGFLRKGTERARLTSGPLSFFAPLASVDGKRIFVLGLRFKSELIRYDAVRKQFVPYLGGISVSHVAFSDDGQWVAYVDYPSSRLWRSRIDGSEKLQLTTGDTFPLQPTWSPDGSEIAFSAIGTGTPWRMYKVKASGGAPPEPLLLEDKGQSGPVWSADGKSIIFGRVVARDSSLSLFQLDLDTHKVTDIPGSEDLSDPVGSRDGRYLVATTKDGATLKAYDFTTRKWTELVRAPLTDYGFFRDDKTVFYMDPVKQGMFRVRISDRKVEQIADISHIDQPTMPYGFRWTGIAPDGSPLLMRDVGIGEIYALELEK